MENKRSAAFPVGEFSTGIGCVPAVLLGIYWKGMTRQGALSSMLGGFIIILGLFSPTLFGGDRIDLLGLHPNLWSVGGSFALGILVSKWTGPPPKHLVTRYFYSK